MKKSLWNGKLNFSFVVTSNSKKEITRKDAVKTYYLLKDIINTFLEDNNYDAEVSWDSLEQKAEDER